MYDKMRLHLYDNEAAFAWIKFGFLLFHLLSQKFVGILILVPSFNFHTLISTLFLC